MAIDFKDLERSDLVIDEIYCGGTVPNMSSEVLNKLMLCSNSGGFRQVKNKDGKYAYCVLYTTGEDVDWKDYLDAELGRFIYYGDNKKEGHSIHNTSRKGNEILRTCFEKLENNDRDSIIPFFIFQKVKGRDVRFLGLAVPGDDRLTKEEQLISVWSQKDGRRYQNYKAIFSILDVSTIDRRWLIDLKNSIDNSEYAPEVWKEWQKKGKCKHLTAKKVVQYRNKEEQLPKQEQDLKMLREIYNYFDDPYEFEKCAAKIAQLMDKLDAKVQEGQDVVADLYDEMNPYLITNMSRGRLINEIWNVRNYTRNDLVEIQGNYQQVLICILSYGIMESRLIRKISLFFSK